jgi:outer membrane lipoprotein SlyB
MVTVYTFGKEDLLYEQMGTIQIRKHHNNETRRIHMLQGGSLWAGVISGGITQIQDTRYLTNGQMGKKEYALKTTGNVTGAFGLMAGVEYGALLGTSLLPGVGTVIGSVVGGLIGDRLGRTIGVQAGNALVSNPILNNVMPAAIREEQPPMTENLMYTI